MNQSTEINVINFLNEELKTVNNRFKKFKLNIEAAQDDSGNLMYEANIGNGLVREIYFVEGTRRLEDRLEILEKLDEANIPVPIAAVSTLMGLSPQMTFKYFLADFESKKIYFLDEASTLDSKYETLDDLVEEISRRLKAV